MGLKNGEGGLSAMQGLVGLKQYLNQYSGSLELLLMIIDCSNANPLPPPPTNNTPELKTFVVGKFELEFNCVNL